MFIDVFDSANKWVSRVFPQKNSPSSKRKITLTLSLGGENYSVGFRTYKQSDTAKVYFNITNFIDNESYRYFLHTIGDELTAPYHNYPVGYDSNGKRASNEDSSSYDFNNDVFVGWRYNSTDYFADGEIEVNPGKSYTLTAKWSTSHSSGSAATVVWRANGSTYSSSSAVVGQGIYPPATNPSKSNHTFLGWFSPGGRRIYDDTFVPCTSITYSALFELDSFLSPTGSNTHYSSEDILVYEDNIGVSTVKGSEETSHPALGTIYGKVNVIAVNQHDGLVDVSYLFQAKHSVAAGDTWFDNNIKYKINAYSSETGTTPVSSATAGYDLFNSYHCFGTENGVEKYAGLLTRANQPSSTKFGPLSEEYCLNLSDFNTQLISKPTGSMGLITFQMPQPGSDGFSNAYIDFSWEWTKGSNGVGISPWFSNYNKTTPTRLKVQFDWNVRYYRNWPDDTSDTLCLTEVKQPNVNYTVKDVPSSAVPNGYRFVGWNTYKNGEGEPYGVGSTIDDNEGNWKLYAQWELATRELKFHPNGDGATCPETQRTVYINERYDKDGALPEAVRNNYRFIGWFTEAVNGNRINDDDIVPQGTTDIHAYAHWTSAWDAEVTLTFLCHKRPKLYLSAKRHSLEQPDAVTLCMKPELETLPQEGDHKDKNFVSNVYRYMEYKLENRTDTSWSGDDVQRAYPDRTAYSDPEYPTWLTFINNASGPVLTNSRGVFRVDAMNSAKTKFVEFDIDKEYQLRARIWDALGYASEIKYNIPSNPAATYEDDGRKLLYSNDKYCTLSLWSNVALLLKYITKLFVHNPYMDEVLKESRSLSIVEGKPVWGKQLREVSNPPETDFWQIREHIQNSIKDKSKVSDMVDAILKLRSNSASVNGFTTAEVKNLIIPTLKRLLADDENLVYDKSQIKPLVNILYQINDTHSKIAREKDEYTESINYSGLKVGDTAKAAEIDAHTSSSRILELDGERHQTSTHWENESDALENRVKDSLYQSVELKNFENDIDDDVAQSTIDHISNYDISQLDLENSLSDLIYILSRMRPRELNSEGPAANDFNTASRDAYNKSHYWDSTNNKFTANAFSNWIDGVWQTPETDINEYKSSIDGYELLVGTTSLDPNNDYGDNDLKNNGCGAACMGLCESGCYGSCVGSCKTACGDSCFYGCTTSCGAACGSDCTGSCVGTCSEDCSSGCKNGCNETCKGGCKTGCKGSCESGCKGCTASCKTECRGDCGSGCTSGCEAKCKLQCTSSCQGQCKDGCTNHCTTNCFSECGANCTSTCSGGCKGTCSGGCNSNCGNACNQACSNGCGGGCTNSCSTNCGSGCEKNCKGYCYQSCLASCTGECGSSCNVSCVLDCSSGCTSGCTNGCGAYCKQSCTGSCTGDCKNTCSTGCTGSCSSNCAEDCENICFAGCGNSCSSGCLTTCMAGCVGGCQNTCDEGCQGGCGIGCDGGCVSTCYNGCGGNQCKGACSTTCDKQCKQGCAILCYNICNVQCSHACHVDCTHDCRELCKLICDNLCENDCEKGCQYYCHGSCREECVNSCQESCFEICSGQCRAECNTFCHTSCQTACGEQCHGECGKTCHSTCSKVCQFNCEELCMTTCNETCEANCGGGCTNGCGTNCTGLCEGNCSSDCGNGCKDGCSTNCTGGCGTGCNQGCLTSCSGGCKSECTTDCEGTCKNGCLSGCHSNCSDACSASCSGSCGGDCEGGCKTGCTGTCGGTCSGTCDSGCKSGCEGSCKTTCTGECVNSCIGGCSDGCGSSCDSSCENSCSNACTHWCTGTAKITA